MEKVAQEDPISEPVKDFEMVLTEGLKTGKCKWFNGTKGWGFVTLNEGGHDVFVHQSILQMKGFRQLGEAEAVEIEFRLTEKGLEAVKVTGPNGDDCRGSKGPHPTKRVRKIRCYNCGEFKNHVASKCLQPPQPKRCHRCKSSEHLIADCPEKPATRNDDGLITVTDGYSDSANSSLDASPSKTIDDATIAVQNITITE